MDINSIFIYSVKVKSSIKQILLFFISIFIICCWQSPAIIGFLQHPVKRLMQTNPNLEFVSLYISEGFLTTVKIAFLASVLITVPFIFIHIYRLVLRYTGKKIISFIFRFALITVIMCIAGAVFAYKVLFTHTLQFLINFNYRLGLKGVYSISAYNEFIIKIMTVCAILFQLPVFIYFLAFIRIVTSDDLRRLRKSVYIIILVICAVFTPASLFSFFITALPLIILYEFSINLVRFFGPESKISYNKNDQDLFS